MIDFGADMDEINAWPIPAIGLHTAIVTDAEETLSKEGDEMMKIEFVVNGGHKAKVYYYMLFTKQALPYTKRALIALGFELKGMKSLKSKDLLGKSCDINIEHNTVPNERNREEMTFANITYLKKTPLEDMDA